MAKRVPGDMGMQGSALWRSVTRDYVLSPVELETLRQCCRQADLIDRLDAGLRDAEVTVAGSMGQVRVHPLVGAVSEARRTLDGLMRGLALPMPDEDAGRRRSPVQVAAAQARWREQRRG